MTRRLLASCWVISLFAGAAVAACGSDSEVASPRGSGGAGGSAGEAGAGGWPAAGSAGADAGTSGQDSFAQACAAVRSWKLACTTDTAAADLVEKMCLESKPCADQLYFDGIATSILDCIAKSSCNAPGDADSSCLEPAAELIDVDQKLVFQQFRDQCESKLNTCHDTQVDPNDPLSVHVCFPHPLYSASYYSALAACVDACTTTGIASCGNNALAAAAPACVDKGWVFARDLPYPNASSD